MSLSPVPDAPVPDAPVSRHDTFALTVQVGDALQARGWKVATAESCTGGGIAAALTEVPGTSAWFEYGLVTYANRAKTSLLGVSTESLAKYGAVSETVVREMARGAVRISGAHLGLSISGVAGPSGGSFDKPVGTVWIGWAQRFESSLELGAQCHHFAGDRRAVREQAVYAALQHLLALAENDAGTV